MPAPRKWTHADNSYLRKVWTDPAVHRDDIVKRLGKTIDTVRMQAKRLGLGGRPRLPPPDEWPDQIRSRAISMWADGESAGVISKAISSGARSYSRNAVLGFFHREGITRLEPKETKKAVPKPKPEKVFKVGQGNVVFVQSPQVAPVSPARAEAFKPLEGFEPVRWTERGKGCAWPLEGLIDGEIPSCGAPIDDSTPGVRRSYCSKHQAMSSAPTGSAKELVRSLRRIA